MSIYFITQALKYVHPDAVRTIFSQPIGNTGQRPSSLARTRKRGLEGRTGNAEELVDPSVPPFKRYHLETSFVPMETTGLSAQHSFKLQSASLPMETTGSASRQHSFDTLSVGLPIETTGPSATSEDQPSEPLSGLSMPCMPIFERLDAQKTTLRQLGAIWQNEGTIDGTIAVHEDIWGTKLGCKTDDAIFSTRLWLVYGDQLTAHHIRSVQSRRAESNLPFDRRDHILPGPGWFHILQALLYLVVRTHF